MSTHTITKWGMVDNSCTKQVFYAIFTLEKELDDAYVQLHELKKCDMYAFIPEYEELITRIITQISDLIHVLRTHYS